MLQQTKIHLLSDYPAEYPHPPRGPFTAHVFGWWSYVWSGYVKNVKTFKPSPVIPPDIRDTLQGYRSVYAEWVVPFVDKITPNPDPNGKLSIWIGLDGHGYPWLIQIGVFADYLGENNSQRWLPFWEFIQPNPDPNLGSIFRAIDTGMVFPDDPSAYPIQPGDTMRARIIREPIFLNPGYPNSPYFVWVTLVLDNLNKGWRYSHSLIYNGPATTAEFIIENPLWNGTQTPMMFFFPGISFDHCLVDERNPNFDVDDRGFLVYKDQGIISKPSEPDADRDGFTCGYGSNEPSPH